MFLRSESSRPLGGVLGWLARTLGLDVFSTSLLGDRARLEMKGAALVLLVVFSFDLAAWGLLFNTILSGKLLQVNTWSLAALVMALLFATAVLLYERQLLTADTSQGWRRLILPTLLRLLVILSSAFVTAQPVELLFFRQPVVARMHQEGIRQQVATQHERLRTLDDLLAEQRAALAALPQTMKQEQEHVELEEVQKERRDLESQVDALTHEEERATRNVKYWTGVIVSRTREVDSARRRVGTVAPDSKQKDREELARTEAALQAAEAAKRRWLSRAADTASKLAAAHDGLRRVEDDVSLAETAYQQRRDELQERIDVGAREIRAEEERLQRWVRTLRELSPAQLNEAVEEEISPDGGGSLFGQRVALVYRLPTYDFFEQLRVISDLWHGSPPLWKGVSSSVETELAATFSLDAPKPCVVSSSRQDDSLSDCDPARWSRHLEVTAIYRYSYFVGYAIALVIPLMVLATKLLMATELKLYYSAAVQAEAGNTDALLLRLAQQGQARRSEV